MARHDGHGDHDHDNHVGHKHVSYSSQAHYHDHNDGGKKRASKKEATAEEDENPLGIDMTGWNAHMRTHIRLNQPVCRGDLLKCNLPPIIKKHKKPWIPIYV